MYEPASPSDSSDTPTSRRRAHRVRRPARHRHRWPLGRTGGRWRPVWVFLCGAAVTLTVVTTYAVIAVAAGWW